MTIAALSKAAENFFALQEKVSGHDLNPCWKGFKSRTSDDLFFHVPPLPLSLRVSKVFAFLRISAVDVRLICVY